MSLADSRRPTPVISGPRRNPTDSAGRSASTCWSTIWLTLGPVSRPRRHSPPSGSGWPAPEA